MSLFLVFVFLPLMLGAVFGGAGGVLWVVKVMLHLFVLGFLWGVWYIFCQLPDGWICALGITVLLVVVYVRMHFREVTGV